MTSTTAHKYTDEYVLAAIAAAEAQDSVFDADGCYTDRNGNRWGEGDDRRRSAESI